MDPNAYTLPFQLTKTMRRDLYPALEPSNAEISASGKIVIITGAGGTVGSVRIANALVNFHVVLDIYYCRSHSSGLSEHPLWR